MDKLAAALSAQITLQINNETQDILRRIFKDWEDNGDSHLYFLQQIQPSEALFSLLKSEFMEKLELSKWRVCEGIKKAAIFLPTLTLCIFDVKDIHMKNYCLFSFMVEAQSPLGKFYAHTKQLVSRGKEYLLQAISNSVSESTRYRYRMIVSLLPFRIIVYTIDL
jgi:hypothetical protein